MTKYLAYDYTLGRFMQVDPKADAAGQESLTPYQYSYNNPVRYNDPDGDCPTCISGLVGVLVGGALGAGIEYGTQVYNNYSSGQSFAESLSNVNGTKILASGAEGAITGGVAGLTGGSSLIVPTTANATASVVVVGVRRAVNGKEVLELGTVATDAIVGAVGGAAASMVNAQVAQPAVNTAIEKVVVNEKAKAGAKFVVSKAPSVARAVSKQGAKKVINMVKNAVSGQGSSSNNYPITIPALTMPSLPSVQSDATSTSTRQILPLEQQ